MSQRFKSMIVAVSVCAAGLVASSPVRGASSDAYMVRDINPGPTCTEFGQTVACGGSVQMKATAMGSSLFFTADDGLYGRELWKSDGTSAGTVMVKDINTEASCPVNGVTGPCGSSVASLTVVGNILYFTANDGTNGNELWKSDGTSAGTVMVKDISSGSCTYPWGSEPCSGWPSQMMAAGNSLYFASNDGTNGNELWKSDGTTAGTVMVKDINPATGCTNYGASADSGCYGMESRVGVFMNFIGSTLYFSADNGIHGMELWKSDGTSAGTVMVKDINVASSSTGTTDSGYSGPVTVIGNTMYFTANDGTNGNELWKSDGTSAGTVMVKDIYPGTCTVGGGTRACSGVYGVPFVVGNTLLFSADDGINGRELWKSDGTSAGTAMVKDINTGASCTEFGQTGPCGGYSRFNGGFVGVAGSNLYFVADDGTNGGELWKSDGTSAGTVMVKDINTGASCTLFGVTGPCGGPVLSPEATVAIANTFYFTANNGINGRELWKSDGTSAGTAMVKDINTGASCTEFGQTGPCGGISNLNDRKFAVGNILYFAANNGTNGVELWSYDGSGSGLSPTLTSPATTMPSSPVTALPTASQGATTVPVVTTATIPSSTNSATTVPIVTTATIPSSTNSATTVPVVTSTTILSTSKSVASASSIANIAAIAIPAGATVTLKVAASSAKYCKVSVGKLVKLKSGICVVSVTVKPKKGKSKSATAKLKFK